MGDFIFLVLSVLTSGLLVGTIFSVLAAGMTLIHGTILLPQAANGHVFLGAALLVWLLSTFYDYPMWVSLPMALIIVAVIAFATEWALLRHFYRFKDRSITYLIVTLGLSQILTGVFSGSFGSLSDMYQVKQPIAGMAILEPYPISNAKLLAFVLGVAVLAGLIVFLRLHRIGRALRAVFQNRDVARLRGINTAHIYRFAFMLGTMIIAAGGVLYSFAYALDLSLAWNVSLITFSIMIVGGPGSVVGALCVGLVFGFTQAIISVFADPTIATFAYLVVMLAILFVKPSGLFVK